MMKSREVYWTTQVMQRNNKKFQSNYKSSFNTWFYLKQEVKYVLGRLQKVVCLKQM